MAPFSLLSKHSSNPLQAPSDDPDNKDYLKELAPILAREKNRGSRDTSSIHDNADQEDDVLLGDSEYGSTPGDDPNATPHAEDEEEMDPEEATLFEKEPQEQAQILGEIDDLEKAVPELKRDYKLIDRLGEGTFSSVYKAIDLHHHTEWDNGSWQGHHPPGSSAHFQSVPHPPGSKVFVAIKRIYVTSSPSRIQNEIALMEDCRGCRHVATLITAFREKDQVVAVMPFHRNVDFRQYFASMTLSCMQSYLRCLLRGLRDIHAREIVHRDIKPANFLFDPESRQGMIVDFGLAQRIDFEVPTSCNHTSASKDAVHGQLKNLSRRDVNRIKDIVAAARKKSTGPSDRVGWHADDNKPSIKANRAGTRGFRAPEVLFKCEDQTAALDIWSVGTIMLSCLTGKFPIFNASDDTEALMEIATILGRKKMEKCAQLHNRTFLTNVPTIDQDGVPWQEFIERLNPSMCGDTSDSEDEATEYQRATDPLLPLAYDLLEKMMHPDLTKRITARGALFHPFLVETVSTPGSEDADVDMENGGIERRECTDATTGRVHVVEGDDLYVPHPYGEGVCRNGHWADEETGEQLCFVILPEQPKKMKRSSDAEKQRRREERAARKSMKERQLGIFTIEMTDETGTSRSVKVKLRKLMAGEGIAIGLEPCEFHRHGMVDASYWHSHLRPMLEAEEGEDLEMEEAEGDEE